LTIILICTTELSASPMEKLIKRKLNDNGNILHY